MMHLLEFQSIITIDKVRQTLGNGTNVGNVEKFIKIIYLSPIIHLLNSMASSNGKAFGKNWCVLSNVDCALTLLLSVWLCAAFSSLIVLICLNPFGY